MTTRTAYLVIAAFVAFTIWLLAGAVLTAAHRAEVWPSGDGDRVEVREP